LCTMNLYPVIFMNRCYTCLAILNDLTNQILHLIMLTQWCNGNYLP
jgi:hypothetical protein